MALLQDKEKGTLEDKIRLLCIYYMSQKSASPDIITQMEQTLTEQGCDLSPFEYIKKYK